MLHYRIKKNISTIGPNGHHTTNFAKIKVRAYYRVKDKRGLFKFLRV